MTKLCGKIFQWNQKTDFPPLPEIVRRAIKCGSSRFYGVQPDVWDVIAVVGARNKNEALRIADRDYCADWEFPLECERELRMSGGKVGSLVPWNKMTG